MKYHGNVVRIPQHIQQYTGTEHPATKATSRVQLQAVPSQQTASVSVAMVLNVAWTFTVLNLRFLFV